MQISSNNIPQNEISFRGVRFKFKTYGKVSEPFKKEIAEGLNEFPGVITAKLNRTGLFDNLRFAKKASNAYPEHPDLQNELKTQLCSGTSITFDEFLSGLRINSKHFSLSFFSSPLKTISPNKGVVGHEVSHVVDELINKAIGIDFSQTKGFREVVLC